MGRWKFSPRSWELSGRFQKLPGLFLGEAEVLSFAALLDLFQMCLLALPELTVPFPALPQVALRVFWPVGTNVPRK